MEEKAGEGPKRFYDVRFACDARSFHQLVCPTTVPRRSDGTAELHNDKRVKEGSRVFDLRELCQLWTAVPGQDTAKVADGLQRFAQLAAERATRDSRRVVCVCRRCFKALKRGVDDAVGDRPLQPNANGGSSGGAQAAVGAAAPSQSRPAPAAVPLPSSQQQEPQGQQQAVVRRPGASAAEARVAELEAQLEAQRRAQAEEKKRYRRKVAGLRSTLDQLQTRVLELAGGADAAGHTAAAGSREKAPPPVAHTAAAAGVPAAASGACALAAGGQTPLPAAAEAQARPGPSAAGAARRCHPSSQQLPPPAAPVTAPQQVPPATTGHVAAVPLAAQAGEASGGGGGGGRHRKQSRTSSHVGATTEDAHAARASAEPQAPQRTPPQSAPSAAVGVQPPDTARPAVQVGTKAASPAAAAAELKALAQAVGAVMQLHGRLAAVCEEYGAAAAAAATTPASAAGEAGAAAIAQQLAAAAGAIGTAGVAGGAAAVALQQPVQLGVAGASGGGAPGASTAQPQAAVPAAALPAHQMLGGAAGAPRQALAAHVAPAGWAEAHARSGGVSSQGRGGDAGANLQQPVSQGRQPARAPPRLPLDQCVTVYSYAPFRASLSFAAHEALMERSTEVWRGEPAVPVQLGDDPDARIFLRLRHWTYGPHGRCKAHNALVSAEQDVHKAAWREAAAVRLSSAAGQFRVVASIERTRAPAAPPCGGAGGGSAAQQAVAAQPAGAAAPRRSGGGPASSPRGRKRTTRGCGAPGAAAATTASGTAITVSSRDSGDSSDGSGDGGDDGSDGGDSDGSSSDDSSSGGGDSDDSGDSSSGSGEEVELVADLDPAAARQAKRRRVAEPGQEGSGGGGDCEEGMCIAGEMEGQVATRDLPHPRHACAVHAFAAGTSTSNSACCSQCFCYVCDVKASECRFWGTGTRARDHAHAHRHDYWDWLRRQRQTRGWRRVTLEHRAAGPLPDMEDEPQR